MNKFIPSTFALMLSFSAVADNIDMVMNGVKVLDVIEGTELHSFSVDTIYWPAPCPANRIVFDATLPLARTALNLLLDAEHDGTKMEMIEYQYGDNGQCHLREFAEEDPTKGWSFDQVFPQDKVWVDPRGIPRLVAIGCPDPFNYGVDTLYWEFTQFGGSSGDTMQQFSGDMCISTRSEFLDQVNWNFKAQWRVCLNNNLCTPYVEVTR